MQGQRDGRVLRRFIGFLIVIGFVLASGVGQAAVYRSSTPVPCVTILLSPPGVDVGPCVWQSEEPEADGSDSGIGLEAIHDGGDIEVNWSLPATNDSLVAIHVFRGADETTPHYTASVSPEASSYVDELAGLETDASWYRIVVEYESGGTETSPATSAHWKISTAT